MKRRFYLLSGIGLASLLVALLLLGLAAAPAAAYQTPTPAEAAANWLIITHQNDDGGYTSFSAGANQAPSDPGGTVDALLALAAAGADTTEPLAFLQSDPDALAAYASQGGGPAGKLVLALVSAGADPRDAAGTDVVVSLTSHLSTTGSFNAATAFDQSLAILALAAVEEPIPAEAVDWLLSLQAAEGETAGSWDDGFGTLGNPDNTAMAVMALLASGMAADEAPIAAARAFLAQAQLPSGGWSYGPGLPESVNSTALVIQALRALAEEFTAAGNEWQQADGGPLDALLAWQSESGAFQADFGSGRFDDFFTTVQAIPAVSGLTVETEPAQLPTPTDEPTAVPTEEPTEEPTAVPTEEATAVPTEEATAEPTEAVQATAEPATTDASDAAADSGQDDGGVPWLVIGLAVVVIGGAAVWWFRNSGR
jgi:hypothetical protein